MEIDREREKEREGETETERTRERQIEKGREIDRGDIDREREGD